LPIRRMFTCIAFIVITMLFHKSSARQATAVGERCSAPMREF
jgi:hypothetical protein